MVPAVPRINIRQSGGRSGGKAWREGLEGRPGRIYMGETRGKFLGKGLGKRSGGKI